MCDRFQWYASINLRMGKTLVILNFLSAHDLNVWLEKKKRVSQLPSRDQFYSLIELDTFGAVLSDHTNPNTYYQFRFLTRELYDHWYHCNLKGVEGRLVVDDLNKI